MARSFSIGEVARRTGVATSALRFYEDKGLIESERTDGNQRRYAPSVVRVVSVIRAAHEVGISLAEVGEVLDRLPSGHAPTATEWGEMASAWQERLEERIGVLVALRDSLSDCIGCGCLSLETCAIFNPDDRAGAGGSGGRFLYGDPRPAGA